MCGYEKSTRHTVNGTRDLRTLKSALSSSLWPSFVQYQSYQPICVVEYNKIHPFSIKTKTPPGHDPTLILRQWKQTCQNRMTPKKPEAKRILHPVACSKLPPRTRLNSRRLLWNFEESSEASVERKIVNVVDIVQSLNRYRWSTFKNRWCSWCGWKK